MECPHCAQETDPTLLFCKVCGQAIELDPEAVARSIERDERKEAIEHAERETLGALYVSLFCLACVIGLRLVLLKPVSGEVSPGHYAPARVVEERRLDPPSVVELEPAPIPIPTEERK